MDKRIVSLEYELKAGGKLLESSTERGPLRFVSGEGQLLPALEKRIAELKPGQEESGVIKAADAFGDTSKLPTKSIARKEFPADAKLDPNSIFQAGSAAGPVQLQVVKLDGETVQVRFLHPLHAEDISYRIKVLAVEDASRPPPLPGAAVDLVEEN
jgi:FKBP-type peptidyl-prolyl cis-trans isomerase 2